MSSRSLIFVLKKSFAASLAGPYIIKGKSFARRFLTNNAIKSTESAINSSNPGPEKLSTVGSDILPIVNVKFER